MEVRLVLFSKTPAHTRFRHAFPSFESCCRALPKSFINAIPYFWPFLCPSFLFLMGSPKDPLSPPCPEVPKVQWWYINVFFHALFNPPSRAKEVNIRPCLPRPPLLHDTGNSCFHFLCVLFLHPTRSSSFATPFFSYLRFVPSASTNFGLASRLLACNHPTQLPPLPHWIPYKLPLAHDPPSLTPLLLSDCSIPSCLLTLL